MVGKRRGNVGGRLVAELSAAHREECGAGEGDTVGAQGDKGLLPGGSGLVWGRRERFNPQPVDAREEACTWLPGPRAPSDLGWSHGSC